MPGTFPRERFDATRPRTNCACEGAPIVLRYGVERCSVCGKLAGSAVFVPFGSALPTEPARRRRVRA
jgi:hypothetical protein